MRDLNVMINPRLISKQCEGPEHVNRPGNSLGLRLLGVNSRKGGGTQLLCSAPRAQLVWCGQASDVCRLRCLSLLCGACVRACASPASRDDWCRLGSSAADSEENLVSP